MSERVIPRSIRAIALRVAVALAAGTPGCVSPAIERPVDVRDPSGEATLEHGYNLLLDLLADESKVEGILAIKSPRSGIVDLLRRISAEAASDQALLRSKMNEPPAVDPGSSGLPLLEVDVRRRIERDETPGLLLAGGRRFETRMLLTQQKAAQYAGALCAGLAVADPNRTRSAELKGMSTRWIALEREIRSWLTVVDTPPTSTGTTSDPVPTP
jgi:hypothetical protein